MPRDGSAQQPASPPEPINIGEVADPPFAVLPDPAKVFARRADRFDALAPGHELEGYLRFLASVCRAQHEAQTGLRPVVLPPDERLVQMRVNGMPPLALDAATRDDVGEATFVALLNALRGKDLTAASRAALDEVAAATPAERKSMMSAVLLDEVPHDRIAQHVLAAAAVQVHMARLAAALDVATLTRITDGACPACGGAPVASALVNWDGAHGTRFCTCSTCATQWHVARIRCLVCSAEKGIAYHSIEGSTGNVSGETCESCKSYVKIVHQHKDAALEPLADDAASLALDLTLAKEGWQRAAFNPFLMGY